MLISETYFTDRSYIKVTQLSQLIIPIIYIILYSHNASAIIIKSIIKHKDLAKYETNYLQDTIIKIKMLF